MSSDGPIAGVDGFRPVSVVRGIIFDLDGTLIDSKLDFEAIRRDLGLAPSTPILEAIESIQDFASQQQARQILHSHEIMGALQAAPFVGVNDFLGWLREQSIQTAVLTRNSRASVDVALARTNLTFSQVITREEAPPKPDPAGLELICHRWQIPKHEVLFFGDYLFDLEAGERAGIKTVLFSPNDIPSYASRANFRISSYIDAQIWLSENFLLPLANR